jgi:hypothetical protein
LPTCQSDVCSSRIERIVRVMPGGSGDARRCVGRTDVRAR